LSLSHPAAAAAAEGSMANFAPPIPLDSDSLRRGVDPQEQEALFGRVLSYIYDVLPDPPISVDGHLCILFDADGPLVQAGQRRSGQCPTPRAALPADFSTIR
jgi:hypothetical protein